MANKATEFQNETLRYLGENRLKELRALKKSDWQWFWDLKIDHHKSYFIKGGKEELRKFELLFLGLAVYDKPLFKKFQLFEYIKGTSYEDKEEYEYDCDLAIIHAHDKHMGIGNTEHWIITSLIEKLAERNRMGLATLVLSERNFDEVESSGEVIVIDLGGWTMTKTIKQRIGEIKTKQGSNIISEEVEEKQNRKMTDEHVAFD